MAKDTSRTANVNFKINGAANSKEQVDVIRESLEKFGDSGKKAAQSVADNLLAMQRAYDKVQTKIVEGRVVTDRELKEMTVAYKRLNESIEATGKEVSDLPEAFREGHELAGKQIEITRLEVIKSNKAIEDSKKVTNEAGASWRGLGEELKDAIGKFGGAASAVGLVFKAFKEGWAIGHGVAEQMGTDFQQMDSAWANLKRSVKGYVDTLTTEGFAQATLQAIASTKNLGDTVNGTGAAMVGYNTIVALGVSRFDAMRVSQEALVIIAGHHNRAIQGGIEALKLFQKTVRETDPTELAAKLTSLIGKFDELATANKRATDAENERQAAVKSGIEQINSFLAQLEQERQARRLGVDEMNAEIGVWQNYKQALEKSLDAAQANQFVHNGLSDAMRGTLQELQAATAQWETSKQQVGLFNVALQEDAKIHADALSPAMRKTISELNTLISNYKDGDVVSKGRVQMLIEEALRLGEVSSETSKNAIVFDAATGKWTNHKKATEDLNVAIDQTKVAISNTSKEVDDHGVKLDRLKGIISNTEDGVRKLGDKGGTFSAMGDTLRTAGQEVETLKGKLDALDGTLKTIATSARNAAEEIAGIAKAGGSATSSSTPSAQTPPPPPTSSSRTSMPSGSIQ